MSNMALLAAALSICCTTAGGLLVEASKVNGKARSCHRMVNATELLVQVPYNTFVLFGAVQILKLSISAAMQLHSGHSMRQWPSPLYAIPAAAYMVSDNLVVLILTYLDPATMNLMWNLKGHHEGWFLATPSPHCLSPSALDRPSYDFVPLQDHHCPAMGSLRSSPSPPLTLA